MKSLPKPVALELFYLLIRVAWIDLELSLAEKITIFELGVRLGLDVEDTAPIGNALEARDPIPNPNLALLREHKLTVMQAVERIITADGEIDDVELEISRVIAEELLDG